MTADNPQPKFTDEQLLAYLDGEVEPEVAAQIEASSADVRRARDLTKLQNNLAARLYRVDCPDSIDLGEYHLGLFDQSRARIFRRHLRDCPHCTKELEQLSQFIDLEQPEPATGPLEQVRVLIGQIISRLDESTRPPSLAPAFALRGGEMEVLVFEAGDLQITLELQEGGEPGMKILLGLVTGQDAQGFSVKLLSNGQQIASGEVDELGNFALLSFPAGEYQLLIRGPDLEIHLPDLKL